MVLVRRPLARTCGHVAEPWSMALVTYPFSYPPIQLRSVIGILSEKCKWTSCMSTQLISCFWICSACNIVDSTLHHINHSACECCIANYDLLVIIKNFELYYVVLRHALSDAKTWVNKCWFPSFFFVSCSLYWFIGGAEEPVAPARKAPLATSAQENNSRGIHSRKSQVTKAWVLHKWFILTVQYDHD